MLNVNNINATLNRQVVEGTWGRPHAQVKTLDSSKRNCSHRDLNVNFSQMVADQLSPQTEMKIVKNKLEHTSCINFLQIGRMSLLRVAENIITCLSWGVTRKISWMSQRMSTIPNRI